MEQRLTRWGNSVGIRLGADIREMAGVKAGDYLQVRLLDNGDIRLRPAHPKKVLAAETMPVDVTGPAVDEPW